MYDFNERLAAFSSRLHQLTDEIKKVTTDYELLLSRQLAINPTIQNIPRGHSTTAVSINGAITKSDETHLTTNEFYTNIFEQKGHCLDISEVIRAVNKSNAEVIPVQIINIKSYLLRKLKKLCTDGLLVEEDYLINSKGKAYGLPAWVGADGWMMSEYCQPKYAPYAKVRFK